ncbi:MAG: hypothetical protein ACREBS_05440 [Nitrososphaerales archaeon]
MNQVLLPPERRACYSSFKEHLRRRGFAVYPCEFDCGSTKHPLVDVAARMGSFYWAFEYKSETDSIGRGVKQVECYSHWFDYVVLVLEHSLEHTRSDLYWDLKRVGAGLWQYYPSSQKCFERTNPGLQEPVARNRRTVVRRFRAVRRKRALLTDISLYRTPSLTDFSS